MNPNFWGTPILSNDLFWEENKSVEETVEDEQDSDDFNDN